MKIRPFPTLQLLIVAPLVLNTHTLALRLPSWPVSISFSRPKSRSSTQGNDLWTKWLSARQVPGLSKSEVDSLFLNTQSLNSYAHKPDCFKRAAGRVRSLCGNIDGEGMDGDERVRAAITMTVCELNTALQLPPLECAVFSFSSMSSSGESPPYWDDSADQDMELEKSQVSCVSALSRSPQSWSSYSGYLREVPQLCYAFRRWNDIDTARQIYTNITLEKLSLLGHLHLREERWEEGMEGWVGVVKDLQDVLQMMRTSFDDREEEFDRFQRGFDEKLSQFKQSLTALQTQEEVGYMRSLSRVDEAFEGVVGRHEQMLLALLPSLERTLSSYLSEVLVRNADVFEFGNQVRKQWTEFGADFATMHESTRSLSLLSTTLISSLTHSQALSNSILDAQLRTHDTINQVGKLAREEMGKINETAVGVVQGMKERQRESEVGWKVWKAMAGILRWVGRGVLGVEHVYIDQLTHFPHIALSLFTFLWYLFRMTFSSFMSVLVVLISSKRFFSGFLATHTHNHDLESQSHAQPQSRCPNPQTFTQTPIPPPTSYLQVPHPISGLRPTDLDPRLLHLYIRSGPRFSRIPDRLCKRKSQVTGDHPRWG